jgi:hypothetical protein
MSMIDVGMRLGDAIDPCHLANGFEAVIGYECQVERETGSSRVTWEDSVWVGVLQRAQARPPGTLTLRSG